MAAVTVYSAPDDGRKGHPKHVELLINTILPELHLFGLLYIQIEHSKTVSERKAIQLFWGLSHVRWLDR